MNNEESIESKLSNDKRYVTTSCGTSMYPMLRRCNDQVMITPFNVIEKYDVVLYKASDGRYTLHRIIDFEDDYCVIRGDNLFFYEYVPINKIIGKLEYFWRGKKGFSTDNRVYKLYVYVNVNSFLLRRFFLTKKKRIIRCAYRMFRRITDEKRLFSRKISDSSCKIGNMQK